jgi:cellulose synthase/poly-beta-1,6-N-acetylglucosamine synthase-like glycosyltransferase
MESVVEATGAIVLAYFLALNLVFAVFTLIAWRLLLTHRRSQDSITIEEVFRSPLTPPVTVLLPAFNERAGVVEAVRSLLQLRYPEVEIIVIDDGSTDRTLDVLDEAFGLEPVRKALPDLVPSRPVRAVYVSRQHRNVWVVSKDNGGKADALNCGLNLARYPYVCAVDGDALLEEQSLLRVMLPIVEDSSVVAAGGIVRIANGCKVEHGRVTRVGLPRSPVATLQVVEYLRAFLVGRVGWASMGALLIISGAFGVFKRSALVEAGGYLTSTVGEDMELVVRLHRRLRHAGTKYKMAFTPDPVCWTEAPERLTVLARQRRRWHRGLAETLWRHRRAMIEPRQGVFGRMAIPFFILFELIGPVVEVAGYLLIPIAASMGWLSLDFLVAFLILAIAWGVLLSVSAVALEELTFRKYPRRREVLRLTLYSVLDNLGYRQLTNLWRLQGLWQFLRRERGWGHMPRRGFGASGQPGRHRARPASQSPRPPAPRRRAGV